MTPESDLANDSDNKVYTITVYRESGPVLSDDATLAANNGLSLNEGTTTTNVPLMPTIAAGIAAGTTEYTARVDNDVEYVTIAAAATGAPGATYRITPADDIADVDGELDTQGHQVYLTAGTNIRITVTVTAENRSTNTYTVMVYRERAPESDNGNLSALSLDGVSLSPTFAPETTEYNARVRYNVTEVTVEATAADIGATSLLDLR